MSTINASVCVFYILEYLFVISCKITMTNKTWKVFMENLNTRRLVFLSLYEDESRPYQNGTIAKSFKRTRILFLFLVTFFLSLPSPFLKLPSNTYGPLKKTNWINLNFASNAGFTSLCGSRSRRDNKKIKKTSNFSKGPVHL